MLLYGFRQRPILPGRLQPSTFGTEGLNFCVRNGNRWDPFVITTGNIELKSGLKAVSGSFMPLRPSLLRSRSASPSVPTCSRLPFLSTGASIPSSGFRSAPLLPSRSPFGSLSGFRFASCLAPSSVSLPPRFLSFRSSSALAPLFARFSLRSPSCFPFGPLSGSLPFPLAFRFLSAPLLFFVSTLSRCRFSFPRFRFLTRSRFSALSPSSSLPLRFPFASVLPPAPFRFFSPLSASLSLCFLRFLSASGRLPFPGPLPSPFPFLLPFRFALWFPLLSASLVSCSLRSAFSFPSASFPRLPFSFRLPFCFSPCSPLSLPSVPSASGFPFPLLFPVLRFALALLPPALFRFQCFFSLRLFFLPSPFPFRFLQVPFAFGFPRSVLFRPLRLPSVRFPSVPASLPPRFLSFFSAFPSGAFLYPDNCTSNDSLVRPSIDLFYLDLAFKLSFRPISIIKLHVLPHFHR